MTQFMAKAWLAHLCQTIPGVTQGVVVLQPPGGSSSPAAHWPEDAGRAAELTAAAHAAASRSRVVTRSQPVPRDAAPPPSQIAVPFSTAAGLRGGVAVEVAASESVESAALIDRLQRGTAWLDAFDRSVRAEGRLATAVELVAIALEHDHARAASSALATELATRLGCERVSIGFLRRGQTSVEALSHSAEFDPRSNLVRDLAAAMDEASDQDATVIHPAPPDSPPRIARAHEALAKRCGAGLVWTIPMASGGRVIGAITFEQPRSQGGNADTLELCEDLASLLGPILELKRAADARLLDRGREFLQLQAAKLFGPDHPTMKLAAVALGAVVLFLSFANGDFRVGADATLEGRVQRAIVAGIEGYISEANARAGDVVRRGQILGRLDERDLLLEHRKWSGRLDQLRRENREALAGHDRTQVNVLSAKVAQAEAELGLLNENLARTRLIAPFDGIVVRGDLSQSLGSPVEKGEVLFELAPLEGYRVILKVDERDIAHVATGQRGDLELSALPGRAFPFSLERVTPVSTAEDGRNYFRVEARLEAAAASLRPGMEGIAKVEIERRRLIWIWTHHLTDWLRLWAWSWLP